MKNLQKITSLLLALALLAGCGAGASSASSSATPTPTPTPEPDKPLEAEVTVVQQDIGVQLFVLPVQQLEPEMLFREMPARFPQVWTVQALQLIF